MPLQVKRLRERVDSLTAQLTVDKDRAPPSTSTVRRQLIIQPRVTW